MQQRRRRRTGQSRRKGKDVREVREVGNRASRLGTERPTRDTLAVRRKRRPSCQRHDRSRIAPSRLTAFVLPTKHTAKEARRSYSCTAGRATAAIGRGSSRRSRSGSKSSRSIARVTAHRALRASRGRLHAGVEPLSDDGGSATLQCDPRDGRRSSLPTSAGPVPVICLGRRWQPRPGSGRQPDRLRATRGDPRIAHTHSSPTCSRRS